jgi:hypothetical protein
VGCTKGDDGMVMVDSVGLPPLGFPVLASGLASGSLATGDPHRFNAFPRSADLTGLLM